MGRIKSSCIVVLLSFTASCGQYQEPKKYSELPVRQNQTILEVEEFERLPYSQQQQVMCLADNIFFEAGIESDQGKVAVGMVTMNRVKSGKYPNNVCSVVRQKKYGKCQFAWWCSIRRRNQALQPSVKLRESDRYQKSKQIALAIYQNHDRYNDVTQGAMYFHEVSASPVWRRSLQQTVQIGKHIFYKVKHNETKPGSA